MVAVLVLCASSSLAQEVRDFGTTLRGRLGDRSVTAEAQAAAEQAGIDCEATDARLRGRDATGVMQYEVACRDQPGYLVIGSPENRAVSCLADGVPCSLPANSRPNRVLASMAEDAGLECRVDQGVMIGLSEAGAPIYEIGCADRDGAWVEPSADGWLVTDCLTVRAQGGACRFSTEAESLRSFEDYLASGPVADCAVADLRAMGQSERGRYFEIRCEGGSHMVARFDFGMQLQETIPCERAYGYAGGCQLHRPD